MQLGCGHRGRHRRLLRQGLFSSRAMACMCMLYQGCRVLWSRCAQVSYFACWSRQYDPLKLTGPRMQLGCSHRGRHRGLLRDQLQRHLSHKQGLGLHVMAR